MGVVPPKPGFLKRLRELCDEHNCLLIFDEVITGFRLAFGGAAEYFGIRPDLVTYGKIIGAGMPVGAYGGRKGDHGSDLTVWSCIPGRYLKRKPGCHGCRFHTAEISL